MKKLLYFMLLFSFLAYYSCDNSSNKTKTPEELKQELKISEQKNPLKYLKSNDIILIPQHKQIRKKTLFKSAKYVPDGGILKGEIKNNASIAKFKDLHFTISFFSKTESVISEQSYILYEFFEPNSTRYISKKIDTPDSYESFSFVITDATPVYE